MEASLMFAKKLYSREFTRGGYPVAAYYHSDSDNNDAIMEEAREYDKVNAWDLYEGFIKLQHIIEFMLLLNYPNIYSLPHKDELTEEQREQANNARHSVIKLMDTLYAG